ncbi:hypothetical protein ACWC0A_19560 [Streptomyces scopuliridis]
MPGSVISAPAPAPATAPVPEPFDPSYDAIDALEDDFLHWVTQRLATPGRRHDLLAHYLNGFLPA